MCKKTKDWKKLEERKEENVLLGRRLERLNDSRLIFRKMEECGGISWWGEYDQLLSQFGLDDNERGSGQEWRERAHERNCRDWMDEVEGKSSLK